ncbi:Chondroitin sulfate proteoglycan 5 [Bagarius yarrelli]|uniref:Chondroitin sulfate proteoglycan 5 n=1 Tax=Bagarius yarrelli TaxID=175774 RepID=A0A556VUQ6_BAGYA|nr:Chondroitin sulfate proteoglycan 5 [Bagarius yarrelli]
MGFCSGCWISVMSALLALLLCPPDARAHAVLRNMTQSVNSTLVAVDGDRSKLDEEITKPLSNMFLILRSGRKPRDGGELGSGLQEDEILPTPAPSPSETTTEDQKLSLDSAETEHLLPEVSEKDLPKVFTNSPWHEDKMKSTVFDLDATHDSDLHHHEPAPTETPFPSQFPSHPEFLTVDFLDTRSHGNKLVPASPTAYELRGREPTAWAIPDNHDYLTVSPSTEGDTTKPDDYDEDVTTTPPPPPPRTFHPHFPKPFIPAREREPPTSRDKVWRSGGVECRTGSVLVNGTCRSKCDTIPNYCLNGGQCSVITEFQVMCLAIGSSALTVLLLFMIVVCFTKKLHTLKTENNKLRKRSSKYRPSSEQPNDNFSLSTIAEGSNPNVRKLCDSPPHARALAYYDNIICQKTMSRYTWECKTKEEPSCEDDPNSQNKLEDTVKSPPPKEDESLNIQNSLTPKHENHTLLGEENSSEWKFCSDVGVFVLSVRMKPEFEDLILQVTSADGLRLGCRIQTLWSGYGQILRVNLQGCERSSVVIKHVVFPKKFQESDISHRRKVRSYQVETHWYKNYSTDERCRIPACLAAQSFGDEQLMVLEDLDAAGFQDRRTSVSDDEIKACLRWLANFHGRFLGVPASGLWPVGTYWHLETRPDELEAMTDLKLKAAAVEIDAVLNGCCFKTIVHGDAKLANFCFSGDGSRVAAVDFQYVGGGCGMKDVVYFLGSCLDERECERRVPEYLDFYFSQLREAVKVKEKEKFCELEDEWRRMFAFAWSDFHRFLLGWMPGHRKINRYSRRLTQEVLKQLTKGSDRAKR